MFRRESEWQARALLFPLPLHPSPTAAALSSNAKVLFFMPDSCDCRLIDSYCDRSEQRVGLSKQSSGKRSRSQALRSSSFCQELPLICCGKRGAVAASHQVFLTGSALSHRMLLLRVRLQMQSELDSPVEPFSTHVARFSDCFTTASKCEPKMPDAATKERIAMQE